MQRINKVRPQIPLPFNLPFNFGRILETLLDLVSENLWNSILVAQKKKRNKLGEMLLRYYFKITCLASKLLSFSLYVQNSIMNAIEMDNVQVENES